MSNVELILNSEVPKGAIVLSGFQGVGLVGTLASQYMADFLDAKLIGFINSSLLPPMALLINGEMQHPMKIYQFKKGSQNYIIFGSELPLPPEVIYDLGKEIALFSKQNKVKHIVCMEGLATKEVPVESEVYGFATDVSKFKFLGKKVNLLKNGIIIGVTSSLMMQAKVHKIPTICLISEAHADFPDGLAAASIIKKLNEIYNLNVNVKDLEKESKKFEEKLWKVITKASELKEATGKTTPPGKIYIG